MARITRGLLIGLYALVLIGAPFWYACRQERHYRGFRVVRPGVLYRSGQLNPAGLHQIVRDYGIRTVVTLRQKDEIREGQGGGDRWEEEFCRQNGIQFVRIPPRAWWVPGRPPPAWKGLRQFLRVMRNPEQFPRPVLVHCFAGVHRTGVFCAVYRIKCEGWSAEEALAEAKRCGYTHLDDEWDVCLCVRSYPGASGRPGSRRADFFFEE